MHNMSLLAYWYPISGTAKTLGQSIRQVQLEPFHICPISQLGRLWPNRFQHFLHVSWAPRGAVERDMQVTTCQVHSLTHVSLLLSERICAPDWWWEKWMRRSLWYLPSQSWQILSPTEGKEDPTEGFLVLQRPNGSDPTMWNYYLQMYT